MTELQRPVFVTVWSLLLGSAAAVIIISNWYELIRNRVGGRTYGSGIPWVGGVLACLALSSSPIELLRDWWFVGLVIDWASLPALISAVVRRKNVDEKR